MKNDPIRSYATAALRRCAEYGRRDEKTLEKLIYERFLPKGEDIAKRKTEEYRPFLEDIRAARETVEHFSAEPEILKNIEEIYFFMPSSPLKKNEVTNRIRFASLSEGVSERAVFARLKKVRLYFAVRRGLFVGDIPDFMK